MPFPAQQSLHLNNSIICISKQAQLLVQWRSMGWRAKPQGQHGQDFFINPTFKHIASTCTGDFANTSAAKPQITGRSARK